jgi:hypothetical protein
VASLKALRNSSDKQDCQRRRPDSLWLHANVTSKIIDVARQKRTVIAATHLPWFMPMAC